jgi:iron(III) transport system substrate-binding protein
MSIFVLVGLLSLTACQNGGDADPSNQTTPPQTEYPTPPQQITLLSDLSAEEIAAYKQNPNTIVIYAALSTAQMERYLPVFAASHPDINVLWLRESTGDMIQRILNEANDPQADVIWGIAVTAILRGRIAGLLQPYSPAGLERVAPSMRDSAEPPSWVGIDVYASALCVNTDKLSELGLPMPSSWQDLTDPVYRNSETGKGYLVMPNPGQSGTGFLTIAAWTQIFGTEDDGWAYMDALHENIDVYTNSGSAPCGMAAAGEYPIGLSFAGEAVEQRRDLGQPIIGIFPIEGLGFEVEASALVDKPAVKPTAKTFLDWAISDEAMREYSWYYPITSVDAPNRYPLPAGYPTDLTQLLIPDPRFNWSAENYERLIEEWTTRYGEKAVE